MTDDVTGNSGASNAFISHGPSAGRISAHAAQVLTPFMADRSTEGLRLLFSVERHATKINFHFALIGRQASDLDRIFLPAPLQKHDRQRRDELWLSTCFEIFLASATSEAYLELNLAPSGDWNAYAFDRYRTGMRNFDGIESPYDASVRSPQGDVWQLHATLTQEQNPGAIHALLPGLFPTESKPATGMILSATAVIKLKDGSQGHWAIAHAGAKPDFHLRQSFRLVL